jgi:hypothetical protein
MLASAVHYNKSVVDNVSVLAVFLKHLNPGTLALALFVALALLTTTRGKEPETRVSAHARDAESQLTIKPCDAWLPTKQEVNATNSVRKISGIKAH